jgi:hypothetical protein
LQRLPHPADKLLRPDGKRAAPSSGVRESCLRARGVTHCGQAGTIILLIFSVGALVDFVLGYIHERTISAGIVTAVFGLLGTAFYLHITQPWKSKDKPDDSDG